VIEPIVISNFLSHDQCQRVIELINDRLDNFETLDSKRRMILFGYDTNYPNPRFDTEMLNPIKDILIPTASGVLELSRKHFDEHTVGLSTMFFAKQVKEDSGMRAHIDAEDHDEFYNCSSVIYLNTPIGGEVSFPDQGVTYIPKEGDLVLFSSTTMHEPKKTESDKFIIGINLTDFKDFVFNFK
jgi:hypothetical protein